MESGTTSEITHCLTLFRVGLFLFVPKTPPFASTSLKDIKGGTYMGIGHRRIKIWEDSGKVEETEVYLPNIKSIVGFLNGTWNFSVYDDCFDGKNKLGDVDASIELYGHTLLIEFKRDRTALTAGQIVKAIRQAKHNSITTVFVFGDTNRPTEYLLFSPKNLQGSGFVKSDTIGLSKVFKNWNNWAKKNSLLDSTDEDWVIAKRYLNAVGGGKRS